MTSEVYKAQVRLLVRTLPYVAAENCFALKGGTAINLFIRDMPRFSVDIDVAYLPVAGRAGSLAAIQAALLRIKAAIEAGIQGSHVTSATTAPENKIVKLMVSIPGAQIKIEANPVLRGSVYPAVELSVSASVEDEFGFAAMQILSFADLYGGKLVAAMDRQHPRDLFDARDLFRNEGVNQDLQRAFLVHLISHKRPAAEILACRRKAIADEYENNFKGMTVEEVPLAESAQLPQDAASVVSEARQQLDRARWEWTRLDNERARIEASIPVIERLLSQIRGEASSLSFSAVDAESPVCPICEVPIDRVLADRCGLSHKLPDADACRARWDQRKADVAQVTLELAELRQEQTSVQPKLALAKQALERSIDAASRLERARDQREAAWYAARRLQDEVLRLKELIAGQAEAELARDEANRRLDKAREQLGAFRDKQARVFGNMSQKFDPIIRALIGEEAKSRITLSGNGLELSVDLGGDRTTAAIESLKIIAFDLAAMCMSVEGTTRIPALLIHDSPREADLGLSIYHRLFHLVRMIEGGHDTPPFQYIVTTTTRPPSELTADPWLRVTLQGSPGSERLLRSDLSGDG